MKLVTVPEMRKIEEDADGHGLSYAQMMENAGYHLAHEAMKLSYANDDEEAIQVLGLVGPGNNGGDTLVALALLAEKGWTARAYLVKRKRTGDALVKRLEEAGGEIFQAEKDGGNEQLSVFIENADLLMDGVLGTGLKLPLKDDVAAILQAANECINKLDWPPFTIAVDCPSGVDSDTGEAAPETLHADATITLAAVKKGLLAMPAFDYCGELRVVEIGSLDELSCWQSVMSEVAEEESMARLLPERKSDAHKGTFGTALIAAGSINYTGAALLAAKAAYRIGAGLVTLAVPGVLHTALAGHLPEVTWLLLPQEMGVIASGAARLLTENMEKVTALLVGPGLGLEDTTKEFISNLLTLAVDRSVRSRIGFVKSVEIREEPKVVNLPPLIFDADGLKLLAKFPGWPKLLQSMAILTPHPGEMSLLSGLSVAEIQADRLEVARKYAHEWGHVVVLKGAFTVVAAPDGRTTTIPVASPALARAGTGDVLAGLICGLRAQGLDPYDAARAGAWVHAQAGLAAAEVMGGTASVMAGDVLDAVSDVLASME